ncbi:hypothetical protein EVAR_75540_1 [Eumeta japonica]|uniref:Uncharacterized protein n=1 Tax=Eumeta variegata TaxID=151549 RepID=A0A4C1UJ09_EUMVA|nr:hypothetical protein EVAR_75540_1 [Eumeta japonica]
MAQTRENDGPLTLVPFDARSGLLTVESWLAPPSSFLVSQIGSRCVLKISFSFFAFKSAERPSYLPWNVAARSAEVSFQHIVDWRAFLSLIVSIEGLNKKKAISNNRK